MNSCGLVVRTFA